jgi:ribonuclease P protein component
VGHEFTWKKEKLKSRKRIERVFKEGKSFSLFPYRVYFLLESPPAGAAPPAEATFKPAAPVRQPSAGAPPGNAASAGSGAALTSGSTSYSPLQAGFSASRRNFKKAVDRNRIKRLSREGYRLQKEPLLRQLRVKGLSMAVFFIYTGRELPDYPTVTEKIGVALHKLLKEIR